ncbi:hypothetical protein WICPIJ_002991 [Wickerhamomyces pijperi]|uniref:CID domain-containing protein n=1 Tax=Wickerhamomyces pijperi TaxID=599730 RepID=A0A9P8QAH7_WICPI|nr:hypothetical protein WICPIJ_002991 [Wickerhamomyces pijperi]
MSYSEETLRTKFDALEESQESIVNTSQWLLFHHRYHDRTVNAWNEYISQCDEKKKLPLLYIANEVIQQSRMKRRMDFVDSFAAILPETIKKCHEQVNDKVKEKMIKMVKVWRDRKIFSKDVEIMGILCPGSTPSVRPSAGSSSSSAAATISSSSASNGKSNGSDRANSPAPQINNNNSPSPTKQVPSSSSSSSSSSIVSGSSSSNSDDIKVTSSIQKHKQTFEQLLLQTEGKLSKDHIPQLESLSSNLEDEINELNQLLNKVRKELHEIKGTTPTPKPVSNPLALLQSLQQPATAQTIADPLALLQSISSSIPQAEASGSVYPDDEDDDEDGYEPESNKETLPQTAPAQFNNAAELLRRIGELSKFSQLNPAATPSPPPLQEEDSMPTYDEGSDSEDEEMLPESTVKELSPIPNPIISKQDLEDVKGADTKDSDGERPKKRLRFAL